MFNYTANQPMFMNGQRPGRGDWQARLAAVMNPNGQGSAPFPQAPQGPGNLPGAGQVPGAPIEMPQVAQPPMAGVNPWEAQMAQLAAGARPMFPGGSPQPPWAENAPPAASGLPPAYEMFLARQRERAGQLPVDPRQYWPQRPGNMPSQLPGVNGREQLQARLAQLSQNPGFRNMLARFFPQGQ